MNHVMTFARLPHLSFLLQEVTLPGIMCTPARMAAPGLAVHHTGDRLNYESLVVTFMIDEQFTAHREMHSWLNGMTGGHDRSELTAQFMEDHYEFAWPVSRVNEQFNALTSTEAGLTIVGVDRKPLLRFLFHNLYITQLGTVRFSTTTTDTNIPLISTATFEYDYFSIVTMV